MKQTILALVAAMPALAIPATAHAEYDILLRRNNGTYERATPGDTTSGDTTSGDTTSRERDRGGYHTRPDESSGTYTGVYNRRGDRVGTVKNDSGGTRFYDNKGDRR